MSLETMRAASLDAWGLLKAAVSEALAGETLELAEKVTLASSWDLVHSVLGGGSADPSEATSALGQVFAFAFTPWMVRMKSDNYPGADGSAPEQMCAAYDSLATYLGEPLSASL